MTDEVPLMAELLSTATRVRFRVPQVEGEERPDRSWHQVTCHLHREDLPFGALPLIYTIGGLSFGDARPRASSEIDYRADDGWTVDDMVRRLRLERGALKLETDYVRGRMMKTDVSVHPNGRMVVRTRNRHEMALRWLNAIKGRKHLRLAVDHAT